MQDKTVKQSDSSNQSESLASTEPQKVRAGGKCQPCKLDITNPSKEECQNCIPESLASEMLLDGKELSILIDKLHPPREIKTPLTDADMEALVEILGQIAIETAKAQLSKCQSIIAKTERQKAFREVGEWLEDEDYFELTDLFRSKFNLPKSEE